MFFQPYTWFIIGLEAENIFSLEFETFFGFGKISVLTGMFRCGLGTSGPQPARLTFLSALVLFRID